MSSVRAPSLSAAESGEMNAAQRRFLALHAAEPGPYRWAWMRRDGQPSRRPDDAARLHAWRKTTDGKTRRSSVTPEELDGLRPYFDGFPKVNEAGLAAIKRWEGGK